MSTYNGSILHNMIIVEHLNGERFGLYWADNDGNNQVHICSVFGFENAIRVANGIAHEQVEFVRHAGFDPTKELKAS